MQISRHLLLAFAVATYLMPSFVRAYDNEAQIRARQALEQKMNQMGAQTPQTSSPPAVVTKPAPTPKPKRARKTAPPVQPAERSMSAPPASSENSTDEKLREALHERMNETPAQPTQPAPVVNTPPMQEETHVAPPPARATKPAPRPETAPAFVNTPSEQSAPATTGSATDQKLQEALHERMNETPAQPVQPAPVVNTPTRPAPRPETAPPLVNTPPAQPAPATTESATDQKLQEALHQRMNETSEAPVTPTQPAPVVNNQSAQQETHGAMPAVSAPEYAPLPTYNDNNPRLKLPPAPTPAPETARRSSKTLALPPITLPALSGPPSPLSPAKQQKLDALLEKYKADQISPEQYHEQRAKILAEP
ncbi:MAG TPA: hypothetical protein VN873_16475 [Candidatus Angelobacter sp.]|nr:hypothetical protein [Candidatus Angelobacter sp.]